MVQWLPPTNCGGMAERLKAHVLKTCLGHTNVGSNPTPSAQRLVIARRVPFLTKQSNREIGDYFARNDKTYWGRCQSGRMGPPAKRLPGRNPRSQVRILSSPPQRNAF